MSLEQKAESQRQYQHAMLDLGTQVVTRSYNELVVTWFSVVVTERDFQFTMCLQVNYSSGVAECPVCYDYVKNIRQPGAMSDNRQPGNHYCNS